MTDKFVIITAGGAGTRMGADIPKQFLILKGLPLIMHSINAFLAYSNAIHIILVLPEEHFDTWKKLCVDHSFTHEHKLCAGGTTRFQSVKNGLQEVDSNGIVAVHDAVRPLVSPGLIQDCFTAAEEYGNAIPAVQPKDSIREVSADGNRPLNRDVVRLVQTPQVFQAEALLNAYNQSEKETFTDDASVIESMGIKIKLVEGCDENIKITTPADMILADALMH